MTELVSACDSVSGSLSSSVLLSDSCFGLKVLCMCEWEMGHLLLHLLVFTGHDFLIQLLVVSDCEMLSSVSLLDFGFVNVT